MVLLKRILILSLATLLLLELTIQVGSWIVWIGHREPPPQQARAGEKIVLCIGDSFTYGMGSSRREFSYPAQLEVMLREQLDPSWRVVNGGHPGRNSRDLLERISGQLQAYEPQFVYIIVGTNDLWTQPELLDLSDAEGLGSNGLGANQFRWELRTLRLMKWMIGGSLTDDTPPNTEAQEMTQLPVAMVDEWLHPNFSLVIEKDGRIAFAGTTLTASVTGDILTLHWQDGGSLELHWHLQDGDLHLRAAGWAEAIKLRRETRMPHSLAIKARSAEAERDYSSAVELYRLAIAEADQEALANWYERLVQCLIHLERVDAVIEVIDLLRTRNAETNEANWARAYCSSLSVMGNREECLAATTSALKQFPDNPFLLQIYGWESYQGGEEEKGIQAMNRVVTLSRDLNNGFRQFIQDRLVTMLRSSQPRKAIEAIAELSRMKDSQKRLTSCISLAQRFLDLDLVEETLETTKLTAVERKKLITLFTTLYSPSDAPYKTLEAHLEQIVGLIQQHGAIAVLTSYPWSNGRIGAIHSLLQHRAQASRMDMTGAFREALETTPHSELFVPDGHCNDRGYGIMAEQVFKDLRKRLAR